MLRIVSRFLGCLIVLAACAPEDEPAEEVRQLGNFALTITGNADTQTQIVLLPSGIVAGWLPPELELVAPPGVPDGLHPILVIFAEQEDVRFGSLPGVDYLEQAVLVPFVRVEGGAQTYNFMPRLHVNRFEAILMGWFWGFAKHLAHVDAGEGVWAVSSLARSPLVSAQLAADGPLTTIDQLPYFAAALALVGDRYVGVSATGPRCFELRYDLAQARVQSIHGSTTVAAPFLDGLLPATFVTDGIATSPIGAFRLVAPYVLGAPHACE